MQAALPEYEVYALRYATREAQRRDHFIGGDPLDGPMPMDYYIWVVVGPGGAYVIDTGFTAEMAKERKRTFLRCPVDSLELLGVDAGAVRDVVLTHMHYDHVGNFHKFPNARFHLQEREMAYATGKYMRYPRIGHVPRGGCGRRGAPQLQAWVEMQRRGRDRPGYQRIRPATRTAWCVRAARRGWLVASTPRYYENMATSGPSPPRSHRPDDRRLSHPGSWRPRPGASRP
jgi:glyoxylase-like metal-dependent hydrolase (beta-lactamase superfamily II)